MVGFDGDRACTQISRAEKSRRLPTSCPINATISTGAATATRFASSTQAPKPSADLTDGTQVGLNPGLSAQADVTMRRIVDGIKRSPAWERGNNAIVIVWDENDYSGFANAQPANKPFPDANTNRVVLTVETNNRYSRHVESKTMYTSFSLLKSMEGAFRLPCLNHACDSNVNVMSDLFGGEQKLVASVGAALGLCALL